VFVECNKHLVPFLLKIAPTQKTISYEFVLRMNNEEDADAIMGNDIYLPLKMLPKLTGNKFYFHEVIGFEVEDKRLGVVGKSSL
jgi:16S rRNA processing protein RimM